VFVLLCFYILPDGRFVPRWARAFGVCGVIWKALYLLPVPLHPTSWPFPLSVLLDLALYTVGVCTQVYRYRRVSSPAQRQQTKWVVLGLAIALAGTFVHIFYGYVWRLDLVPWLMRSGRYLYLYLLLLLPLKTLALLVVPLTLGISILRYRLWDIDFVINRSLVYGALTAFLAAIFAGCLFVISQVFRALTGGQQSAIAIAASGMVFGILFQPARRRLQRFVDRRFYGIQVDYQKTVADYRKTIALDLTDELAQPHFSAYVDLELIGSGGMAQVYKATHPTLGCPVAIKILGKQLVRQVNCRKRFEREAQTVAALKHPNIVQVFDSGQTDDTCYIVMQYVDGPDMSKFLEQRGRLPLAQALPLIRDIASAMDYAHEQGLVHRDIKPSNVMLDRASDTGRDVPYRAILTDFGIAKIVGGTVGLTQTGMFVGTLSYIAPEQIQASAAVDGRADVYAFGILAYEMLTGELPFKHQNPGALLIAHLTQPPPDPGDLSPDLPAQAASAIRRALSKSPGDRHATAGEFADSLLCS
jgi:serine/threonine-protein kinase